MKTLGAQVSYFMNFIFVGSFRIFVSVMIWKLKIIWSFLNSLRSSPLTHFIYLWYSAVIRESRSMLHVSLKVTN